MKVEVINNDTYWSRCPPSSCGRFGAYYQGLSSVQLREVGVGESRQVN